MGVPLRTIYSCSKFALDGFGKSLQSEQSPDYLVTNIYPSYIQTNVSKNALLGDGSASNLTDHNIATGLPVEKAV
jgi:short-subunit dehydrogenase